MTVAAGVNTTEFQKNIKYGATAYHTGNDGDILIITSGDGRYDCKTSKKVPFAKGNPSQSDAEKDLIAQLASNAETVVLNTDVVITKPLSINGKKTIIGNGHRITMDISKESLGYYMLRINAGADVTIKDLIIDGNGVASGIYVLNGATLTVENTSVVYGFPYGLHSNGAVTAENCYFFGLYTAVYSEGKDLLSNCKTYCITTGISIEKDGHLTITGGDHSSIGDIITNNGRLTISNTLLHDTVKKAITNKGTMERDTATVKTKNIGIKNIS